jgi:hypothetical protein
MKSPDDLVPMLPTVDPEARLVFIVNAASGSLACDVKRAAIEAALTEAGREGELRFIRPADLAQAADEAALDALQRRTAVVAVGGDGTVNAVAQAAHAQLLRVHAWPDGGTRAARSRPGRSSGWQPAWPTPHPVNCA